MLIKNLQSRNTPLGLWGSLPPIPQGVKGKMERPRGNPHSRIVLITPVPDAQEYAAKIPFSNQAALFFHQLLQQEGLPTDRVFVIPCVRWGEKALTKNTQEIRDFVQKALVANVFDFVISVGEDATRWIVNNGRKANMSTFAGQLVYPPNLLHKPLFVFSDPKSLVPEICADKRENWWREKNAVRVAGLITKQADKLVRALNERNKHG